uniref:Metal dependent phosphohydrolase n=1 Tax=uncultured Planctomycetota bacterium TaxID=120965 RepID=H5SFS2_9BACT|nr:metal dependent phosphohydrolase [uncultured Planctomycetota bacterium]
MSASELGPSLSQAKMPASSGTLQPMDLRPWEALLTLQSVAQRLRLCQDASSNLQILLAAAAPVIGAESLVWLPSESHLPFHCVGSVSWPQADCARLMALISREHDWLRNPTYLANQPEQTCWQREFSQVHQVLALYLSEHKPLGWLLAINKQGGTRFRRTDTALLLPFLGLIRFYHHSTDRLQELRDLLFGFARSLTAAIDAKDPRRSGHSERTARIAVVLARQLSLSSADLGEIYLAGLLHDIGKLGLPETLLRKPGPWSIEEMRRFQQHVNIGYTFLADLHLLRNILPAVLHHHEYYDGSGYPDGLRGEEIPLIARIVAVADAYDALSTGYYDIPALPIAEVEQRLVNESGQKWDPQIVQALLAARQELLAIRPGSVGQSFCQHMEQALQHCLTAEDVPRHAIQDSMQELALELGDSQSVSASPAHDASDTASGTWAD